MSEKNYYTIDDNNCLYPCMTKEQILSAIAQATGQTITDIDEAFISKVKEYNGNRNLRFWVGTKAQYNAIQTKEEDVVYFVTDENALETLSATVQDHTASLIDVYQKLSTIDDYIIYQDGGAYTDPDVDPDTWALRVWASGRLELCRTATVENLNFLTWSPFKVADVSVMLPDYFELFTDVNVNIIDDCHAWLGRVKARSVNYNSHVYFTVYKINDTDPTPHNFQITVTGFARQEYLDRIRHIVGIE